MSQTTRRGLFGAAALLAAAPSAMAESSAHPDAELIRTCAEHVVNLQVFEASSSDLDDPLWQACCRTHDFISAAKPKTLAGMLAKARAAKAVALNSDGSENPEGTPGLYWAWDLMNDLLAGTAGLGE